MMLCNSVRVAFILLKLGLTHLNLLSVRFFCRVCFGKSHLFLKSKVPSMAVNARRRSRNEEEDRGSAINCTGEMRVVR